MKERKGIKSSKIIHSPPHSNLNPENVIMSSTLKSLVQVSNDVIRMLANPGDKEKYPL